MQLMRICSATAVLIAAQLFAVLPGGAQDRRAAVTVPLPVTIHCTEPLDNKACTGKVTQVDSMQRFEIHLQLKDASGSGVSGAWVNFRATSGAIVGDSTVSVGANGDVRAIWLRSRGSDAVGIGVEAHDSDGRFSAVQYLHLTVSEPPVPLLALLYDETQTFPLAGFENTTLRRPMIVEIRTQADSSDKKGLPIDNPLICQRQRVVFRGSAGTMTPDTAVPEVYRAGPRNSNPRDFWFGCRAQAYWSLGTGAGPREARMSLVAGPGYKVAPQEPYRLNVRARALPRFVLGAVYRIDQTYLGRADGNQVTLRVERPIPGGGTISFDSAAAGSVGIDSVGSTSTGVMVGVSSSIPTRYTNWLTLVAGVDLTSPKRHQYLGFSVLRVLNFPETLPLDVSILAHFGSIDVLKRPADCEAQVSSIPGRKPCETRDDWRPRGVGFMFSVDAGTLLADAIKKLGS